MLELVDDKIDMIQAKEDHGIMIKKIFYFTELIEKIDPYLVLVTFFLVCIGHFRVGGPS